MMEALGSALEPAYPGDDAFEFRLVSRRTPNVFNSFGRDHPKLARPWAYNPAFMNPEDMTRHGLTAGDVVHIRARNDTILGIVEPEADLRPGVISMSHSFGSPGAGGEGPASPVPRARPTTHSAAAPPVDSRATRWTTSSR